MDSRDMRDPESVGAWILMEKTASRENASVVADRLPERLPLFGEAMGVYIGPLDRYGDPRERHIARGRVC